MLVEGVSTDGPKLFGRGTGQDLVNVGGAQW